MRRVATEHKRSLEKEWKKKNKKKGKQGSTNHESGMGDPEIGDNISDDLYLENPQVAKTEELLKFLPLVIETLQAYPEELPRVANLKQKQSKTTKKLKPKPNKVRKRVSEKAELQNKNSSEFKRHKASEEQNEEEKETKEERDARCVEDMHMFNSNKMGAHYDLDSISKPPMDSIDVDIHEIRKNNMGNPNLDKSCLSVRSGDHFIEHFPDDPFHKIDHEGNHGKSNDFNFDVSKLDNHHSFDLSNNDYSEECKELEQKLLNE